MGWKCWLVVALPVSRSAGLARHGMESSNLESGQPDQVFDLIWIWVVGTSNCGGGAFAWLTCV